MVVWGDDPREEERCQLGVGLPAALPQINRRNSRGILRKRPSKYVGVVERTVTDSCEFELGTDLCEASAYIVVWSTYYTRL